MYRYAPVQPYGWSRCANFSLTVVSNVDQEKYNVKKDTSHTFEQRESDWGFTQVGRSLHV